MTAEEYIKKYTKKCSNTISNARGLFSPWLTPYHAGEIAKIAKEEGKKEMLEKIETEIRRRKQSWSHTDKQYVAGGS